MSRASTSRDGVAARCSVAPRLVLLGTLCSLLLGAMPAPAEAQGLNSNGRLESGPLALDSLFKSKGTSTGRSVLDSDPSQSIVRPPLNASNGPHVAARKRPDALGSALGGRRE
jgi:hypothetical protein